MIRVYTASQMHHADRWRALCRRSLQILCHARWLKHAALGTPETAANAREFWQQDEQDVRDADALMVFAAPGDRLRGALVEVGIALACGVPVIVIGEHPDYGTWQYHPGVTRVADLEAALEHLATVRPRYRRAG